MPKKKGDKNSKGLKHHIKHKSRLATLLLIKVLLSFMCLGLGLIAYLFIKEIFSQTISLVLSLVVAVALYLFLFLKVLNQFKF